DGGGSQGTERRNSAAGRARRGSRASRHRQSRQHSRARRRDLVGSRLRRWSRARRRAVGDSASGDGRVTAQDDEGPRAGSAAGRPHARIDLYYGAVQMKRFPQLVRISPAALSAFCLGASVMLAQTGAVAAKSKSVAPAAAPAPVETMAPAEQRTLIDKY